MTRYVVVDASVSLKWALDDEDAVAEAIALRNAAIADEFEMVAPSLWSYEVTNGLIVAVRRRRLESEEEGMQALSHILGLGVRLADPENIVVYDYALRYGIAAYDAAYLALAETLEAPLWTGDRPFYEAVRNTTTLVHWIGDYE